MRSGNLERIISWFFIAVLLTAILAILAMLAGCGADTPPNLIHNANVTGGLGETKGHVKASKQATTQAIVIADKPTRQILAIAVEEDDSALECIQQTSQADADREAEYDRLANDLFTTKTDLNAKIIRLTEQRDAAVKRYDSAWAGGRFWFWFSVIAGSAVIGLIGSWIVAALLTSLTGGSGIWFTIGRWMISNLPLMGPASFISGLIQKKAPAAAASVAAQAAAPITYLIATPQPPTIATAVNPLPS